MCHPQGSRTHRCAGGPPKKRYSFVHPLSASIKLSFWLRGDSQDIPKSTLPLSLQPWTLCTKAVYLCPCNGYYALRNMVRMHSLMQLTLLTHSKPWYVCPTLLLAEMRLTDILWPASHPVVKTKTKKSSVTPRVLSGSVCHLRVVYRVTPCHMGMSPSPT